MLKQVQHDEDKNKEKTKDEMLKQVQHDKEKEKDENKGEIPAVAASR